MFLKKCIYFNRLVKVCWSPWSHEAPEQQQGSQQEPHQIAAWQHLHRVAPPPQRLSSRTQRSKAMCAPVPYPCKLCTSICSIWCMYTYTHIHVHATIAAFYILAIYIHTHIVFPHYRHTHTLTPWLAWHKMKCQEKRHCSLLHLHVDITFHTGTFNIYSSFALFTLTIICQCP